MKATRMISLLLALCFVLLLAGCGTVTSETTEKSPEDLALDTVTGLMDRLVAGDPAGAQKFCVEEIRDADLFQEFFDSENPDDAYEYLGITEENGIAPELLNEEAEASVVNFIKTYNDALFQEYEISDLSVDGDSADAKVTVTYGVDPEKISSMDPSELVSDEERDALIEEHRTEIEAAMESEGQDAAMAILYNLLLPKMMDAMSDYLQSVEPSSEDWNISLTKTEDTWQIASIHSA